MWYAFGLVYSVVLSTFFPGPTGSADRIYQKKKKHKGTFKQEVESHGMARENPLMSVGSKKQTVF